MRISEFLTLLCITGSPWCSAMAQRSRSLTSARLVEWTRASLQIIDSVDCASCPRRTQCERAKSVPPNAAKLYGAVAPPARKLIAVVPHRRSRTRTIEAAESTEHDAILAIDPFPLKLFKHPVFVFAVDLMEQESMCHSVNGIYTGDSGYCIRLLHPVHCRGGGRRRHRTRSTATKRRRADATMECPSHFLPSVFVTITNTIPPRLPPASTDVLRHTPSMDKNQLQCHNLQGFAACTSSAWSDNGSDAAFPYNCADAACEHVYRRRIRTRCNLFERCGHAVILQGGWNRLTGDASDSATTDTLIRKLHASGLRQSNVNVFSNNNNSTAANEGRYPISAKWLIREHIRDLCSKTFCVDRLSIFIHGHVTEKALLLWDLDGNGMIDSKELYKWSELASDLGDCKADSVHVVAAVGVSAKALSRILHRKLRNFKKIFSSIEILVVPDNRRNALDEILQMSANMESSCLRQASQLYLTSSTGRRSRRYSTVDGDVDIDCTINGRQQQSTGCRTVSTIEWFRSRLALSRFSNRDKGSQRSSKDLSQTQQQRRTKPHLNSIPPLSASRRRTHGSHD